MHAAGRPMRGSRLERRDDADSPRFGGSAAAAARRRRRGVAIPLLVCASRVGRDFFLKAYDRLPSQRTSGFRHGAAFSKAGELHGIAGSRRHVGRVQAENLARLLRHRGLGARRRAPMRETAAWKLADSSQPPILYVRRSFTSTREHHTSFA